MQVLDFWKTITVDQSNALERFLALLTDHEFQYCVIGGQAVNAYVDPLVSLDLDIVVAIHQIERLEALVAGEFDVVRFAHSLNITLPGSALRIQIQTDPRYATFPEQAVPREVLGIVLPVADMRDVLRGKIWAVQDPLRRPSKRQKDLADIARLIESYPDLRRHVPADVLARLI
jgi:hypothetical protein